MFVLFFSSSSIPVLRPPPPPSCVAHLRTLLAPLAIEFVVFVLFSFFFLVNFLCFFFSVSSLFECIKLILRGKTEMTCWCGERVVGLSFDGSSMRCGFCLAFGRFLWLEFKPMEDFYGSPVAGDRMPRFR